MVPHVPDTVVVPHMFKSGRFTLGVGCPLLPVSRSHQHGGKDNTSVIPQNRELEEHPRHRTVNIGTRQRLGVEEQHRHRVTECLGNELQSYLLSQSNHEARRHSTLRSHGNSLYFEQHEGWGGYQMHTITHEHITATRMKMDQMGFPFLETCMEVLICKRQGMPF